MSGSTITITLGGETFEVQKLRVGQLRSVATEFAKQRGLDFKGGDPAEIEGILYDQCVQILVYALVDQKPPVTQDKIMDMRTTMQELWAARDAILRHSGILVEKKPVGEGVAGAP